MTENYGEIRAALAVLDKEELPYTVSVGGFDGSGQDDYEIETTIDLSNLLGAENYKAIISCLNQSLPKLPPGCGYQGYEFGASYPDSLCQGGKLYDADSGDGDWLDEPMEDIPCPMCHPWQYIRHRAEFNRDDCEFMGGVRSYIRAIRLTFDIIKNRKLGTEPWKKSA